MPHKISHALRAKLAERGYGYEAYQPAALFVKDGRKLSLVAQPGDPWKAIVFRADMASWAKGAKIGEATAQTAEEAIKAAMGGGDVLAALSRLTASVDALTAVLRA